MTVLASTDLGSGQELVGIIRAALSQPVPMAGQPEVLQHEAQQMGTHVGAPSSTLSGC